MITFNLSDPIHVRFELTCTSVGRPLSQMVWMVNGSDLSNSSSYPVLSDATSGTYNSTIIINFMGEKLETILVMSVVIKEAS
jgi:hypothetical protein